MTHPAIVITVSKTFVFRAEPDDALDITEADAIEEVKADLDFGGLAASDFIVTSQSFPRMPQTGERPEPE